MAQHLHELEHKISKKMRDFAGEQAEQIAELHIAQQQISSQLALLLESLAMPDGAGGGSERGASPPLPGSPTIGSREVGKQMRSRLKLRAVRELTDDAAGDQAYAA